MERNLAFELFLYGVILAGFSLLGHRLDAQIAAAVLGAAALAGMLLCILAVLGMRGLGTRTWSVATLSLVAVLLLVQAVKSWLALSRDPSQKATPMIVTMLCFFAVGQIVALVQRNETTTSARRHDGKTRSHDRTAP